MTNEPEAGLPADERRRPDIPKLLLAVVLLAVAGYLVATRYTSAVVDWHLGDLRRNPADIAAMRALRDMGERALPRLEHELATGDANARVIVVLALGVIEGPGAGKLLAKATADGDSLTASNAVAALGYRRDLFTVRAVVAALADRRFSVRLAARRAMERRSGGIPWWAFGSGGG